MLDRWGKATSKPVNLRWQPHGSDATSNMLFGMLQIEDGPGGCDLIGPLGIAVQVAITVVCAVALVAVWGMESPRRPFVSWLFDISKQVVGAAYGKLWNIAQSILFVKFLADASAYNDQCVWYLMSISTDCLFLTFLCWGANSTMRPILLRRCNVDIGDYDASVVEDKDTCATSHCQESSLPSESHAHNQIRAYLVQLGIWLMIISACRLLLSCMLFFMQHQLYEFYASVFRVLGLVTANQKLIFAVLVFPAAADTFQIVVQDRFLKKQTQEPKDHETS